MHATVWFSRKPTDKRFGWHVPTPQDDSDSVSLFPASGNRLQVSKAILHTWHLGIDANRTRIVCHGACLPIDKTPAMVSEPRFKGRRRPQAGDHSQHAHAGDIDVALWWA